MILVYNMFHLLSLIGCFLVIKCLLFSGSCLKVVLPCILYRSMRMILQKNFTRSIVVCVFSFSSSFLTCYILVGNVSCFKNFSVSSQVHRRKVRAWQMICILSHFVEDDIVGKVTSDLHICLYVSFSPMAFKLFLNILASFTFRSLVEFCLYHFHILFNLSMKKSSFANKD